MNKKITYILCALLAYLCVIEAAIPPKTSSAFGRVPSNSVLQNKLPPKMYEIIANPSSVEVNLSEYKDKVVHLNSDQVNDLKRMLLSDQTYLLDLTKEAVFVPSVVFTFKKNEKLVLLTLSYHAEQISFQHEKQHILLDCDYGFEALKKFTEEAMRLAP